MPTIIPHTPLYSFLWFIERHDLNLEKKILDCGAGGRLPPLTMFNEFGFKTHGIDISKNQIKHANDYSNTKGMTLNIVEGDMRKLPFDNESFSYIYSYNTIFHLTKKDMKQAIDDIRRVLKKDGLFYVNFMSIEDDMSKEGEEQAKGEILLMIGGEKVLHTFLEDDEVADFFEGFEILSLEKRFISKPRDWKDYTACYFDIIAQKL